MKYIFIICLYCLAGSRSPAQFSIGAGITLTGPAGVYIILDNIDLQHDAATLLFNANFKFTGNNDASIKGNTVLSLSNLELNKGNNARLMLSNQVTASGNIFFNGGLLDLHGNVLNLGSTGSLFKETNNSRIIETGAAGGYVIAVANANAPNALNPGNLGAIVTSAANTGLLTIKRGHQAQTGSGLSNSILRYYEILVHNDVNLDATVSLHYSDAELNGLAEPGLALFKSSNQGINWSVQNNTNADAAANFFTKTGYASLAGRYTFSGAAAGALPVVLTNFAALCKPDFIQLNWQTQMEQNSDRFDVQRSATGTDWQKIGTVKSAGNSNRVLLYSYDDHTFNTSAAFYRLAQYDLDGKLTYSDIVKSGCGLPVMFKIAPNPVKDIATITIGNLTSGKASILLYNTAGQQVMQQEIAVPGYSQQYKVNLAAIPPGVYNLVIIQNAMAVQTAKIVRQN